jgi:two-component system sensor histidine kinase DctS
VTDEGTGIDAAVLPTIFQFGQTTKGSQGNGMGLWMVKHVVDRHGGSVKVESEMGKGTTFTIAWPRHANPRREQRSRAAEFRAVGV